MSLIDANGTLIKVEEYGKQSDPAVLFICGWATQLNYWPKKLIDELVKSGFRVITFDNRDIGLSQKFDDRRAHHPMFTFYTSRLLGFQWPAPYLLTDMVNDTVGVLDTLGVDQVNVIGLSLGGMVGQILSAKHKDRVKTFTALMSTTNRLAAFRPNFEIARKVLLAKRHNKSREDLMEEAIDRWLLLGSNDGGRTRDELKQFFEETYQRNHSPMGIRRQLNAVFATGDLRRWTRKISVPSLIIHGDSDPILPPRNGRDIAANIDNSRMEIIEGMGHDLAPKFLPKVTDMLLGHLET